MKIASIISRIKIKISSLWSNLTFSPLKYWNERALAYGENSVLNISLSDKERSSIKEFQIATIFPLLQKELAGSEKKLLDFGCGPGRLSIELADFTKCTVTASDPTKYLLELAPKHPNVHYQLINGDNLPFEDNEFDIIWIFCVLGGIVNKKRLKKAAKELGRVANNNCLLFFIENTSNKTDIISWKYRSVASYITLFKSFYVKHLLDFEHAEEQFSIFAGRYTD